MYFETTDECNARSLEHIYNKRVVEYNREYFDECQLRYEGNDNFRAFTNGLDINTLSVEFFKKFPLMRLERQFRSMNINRTEYDELLAGHRFLMSAPTSGSGYSDWEIFRSATGVLYFIIRSYIGDNILLTVQVINYYINKDGNVIFE